MIQVQMVFRRMTGRGWKYWNACSTDMAAEEGDQGRWEELWRELYNEVKAAIPDAEWAGMGRVSKALEKQ